VVVSMLSLQRTEADAPLGESADRIDEVAQRAPEPVQPPHHERVALTEVIERPRQLGPLAERAAGRVAEDPGASRRGERIMLERELLLDRGDPGGAEQR
jgi:hypothetical protein